MRTAWRGVVTRDTITPNTDEYVTRGTKLRNLIEYSGRPDYWYADLYNEVGDNWLEGYICVSMNAVRITHKTKSSRKKR